MTIKSYPNFIKQQCSSSPTLRVLSGNSPWHWLLKLVIFFQLIFIILTFDNYGVSWDEGFRYRAGEIKLIYYQALFKGKTVITDAFHGDNYAGLFDLGVALLYRIIPIDRYHLSHVLSLLTGLLGIAGAVVTASLVGGPLAGLSSLAILLTLPRYTGHMFFNPKDIPFACCYMWVVYTQCRLINQLPRFSWKMVIVLGVTSGLLMAVRVSGILVFFYLFIILTVFALVKVKNDKDIKESFKDIGFFSLKFLVSFLTAYIILYLFWPRLHFEPVKGIIETITAQSSYSHSHPVLFEGTYQNPSQLPYYYLLKMFVLTTPPLVLFLLSTGVPLGVLGLKEKSRKGKDKLITAYIIFVVSFPLIYIIYKNATVYDGIRHLLFIYPPMVVLASLVLSLGISRLTKLNSRIKSAIFFVFLSACFISSISSIWSLQPYQYTYYNGFVGGLSGAWKKGYDTEYWGTAYKEASEWLSERLETRQGHEAPFKIAITGPPWLSKPFFSDSMEISETPESAHFFISTTRWNFHKRAGGKIIFVAGRQGVPFVVVKAMRDNSK